jgi:hypothetical protein
MHQVGETVLYTLTEQDARQIAEQRPEHKTVGNKAEAGQVLPMTIVRCWGTTPESSVNGQVLLDGNDSLWVTSRSAGEGPGRFIRS